MDDLRGGEFARLPPGIYKIANLVEGVDGDIKLDGIARQPRDPVRGLEEENPFGRGQPVKAVVVDPVGQMVGMIVDLPVLDLDGPQVLADRLACRFPYRSFRTWHGRDPLGFVFPARRPAVTAKAHAITRGKADRSAGLCNPGIASALPMGIAIAP